MVLRQRQIKALAVGALLAWGCTDARKPIHPFEEFSVSKTIGAAGGTITGPNGVKLDIPEGALDENVTLTVETVKSGDYETFPGGSQPDYVIALLPHGTQFKKDVNVTFPHGADNAAEAELYWAKDEESEWGPSDATNVQFGDKLVSADVRHFSCATGENAGAIVKTDSGVSPGSSDDESTSTTKPVTTGSTSSTNPGTSDDETVTTVPDDGGAGTSEPDLTTTDLSSSTTGVSSVTTGSITSDSTDPTTEPDASTDPTTEPDASTDPTTEPDASADPSDPTIDPDASADPSDPSTDPDASADPSDPTIDPDASADASADAADDSAMTDPDAADDTAVTDPDAADDTAVTDPDAADDTAVTDPDAADDTAVTDPDAADDTATTDPDAADDTDSTEPDASGVVDDGDASGIDTTLVLDLDGGDASDPGPFPGDGGDASGPGPFPGDGGPVDPTDDGGGPVDPTDDGGGPVDPTDDGGGPVDPTDDGGGPVDPTDDGGGPVDPTDDGGGPVDPTDADAGDASGPVDPTDDSDVDGGDDTDADDGGATVDLGDAGDAGADAGDEESDAGADAGDDEADAGADAGDDEADAGDEEADAAPDAAAEDGGDGGLASVYWNQSNFAGDLAVFGNAGVIGESVDGDYCISGNTTGTVGFTYNVNQAEGMAANPYDANDNTGMTIQFSRFEGVVLGEARIDTGIEEYCVTVDGDNFDSYGGYIDCDSGPEPNFTGNGSFEFVTISLDVAGEFNVCLSDLDAYGGV